MATGRIDLGPANHHATLCISRVRWLSPHMKYLMRKERIWEDLIQEMYAAAFFAWKQGMDDTEARRFAARRLYAFLKAYGFRHYRGRYIKREKPLESVFNFNIADRGISPRDDPPMPFISRNDDHNGDHLDEKIPALLRKHPEGLPRRKVISRFQIPVWELDRYLAPMIKQGKVVEIKRENTRGRPLSPLLIFIEPGQPLPQPKMAKTEQMERIRQSYFAEGKSIKQIAREFCHDRRTVRKAIHRGNRQG